MNLKYLATLSLVVVVAVCVVFRVVLIHKNEREREN